jgi:hypothetical protein
MLRGVRTSQRLGLIATLAACGIVACYTSPPRSPAQRAADSATAARVQVALASEPSLFARDIVVSVEDGVVNLSGMAWSDDDIETAEPVASAIPGVKSVNNQADAKPLYKVPGPLRSSPDSGDGT